MSRTPPPPSPDRRKAHGFLRCRRGTAALELALLAPLLALVIGGLVEFGLTFHEINRLNSAARAGAQFAIGKASFATDLAGIRRAAEQDMGSDEEALTVSVAEVCQCPGGGGVDCSGTCGSYGKPQTFLTVHVEKPYESLLRHFNLIDATTLSADAVLRIR